MSEACTISSKEIKTWSDFQSRKNFLQRQLQNIEPIVLLGGCSCPSNLPTQLATTCTCHPAKADCPECKQFGNPSALPCTCERKTLLSPEFSAFEAELRELADFRFCHCGKKYEDDWLYCPNCAVKIPPRSPNPHKNCKFWFPSLAYCPTCSLPSFRNKN